MKTKIVIVIVNVLFILACGSDKKSDDTKTDQLRTENTGAACEVAEDCYPDVDTTEIQGEILCLDRVRDGYCTHLCESDDDCCAASGECETGVLQVCSPFESTDQNMCFLSCEESDLPASADGTDQMEANLFCQEYAGTEFICRSSGGGKQNRKVCVPGNCGLGAACETDADCNDADITCLSDFSGGYCGVSGCTENADCPDGSACVVHSNGESYCYLICQTDADCGFCRWDGLSSTCTDDVDFVESGDLKVCPPSDR